MSHSDKLPATQPPGWFVVIAGNTGGPQALSHILPNLPVDFPGTVLVVQQMRNGFTRVLADQMNAICRLPVHEPVDGQTVGMSRILMAQPWAIPTLVKMDDTGDEIGIFLENSTLTSEQPRSRVDAAMTSAAQIYGSKTIGVLLSGFGNDGAVGMRAIGNTGGITLAQDQHSCAIFDLPASAINTGAVQEVLPLWSIADRIVAITGGRLDEIAA